MTETTSARRLRALIEAIDALQHEQTDAAGHVEEVARGVTAAADHPADQRAAVLIYASEVIDRHQQTVAAVAEAAGSILSPERDPGDATADELALLSDLLSDAAHLLAHVAAGRRAIEDAR